MFSSIPEIIATGKKYGASPEDIYGCFYFFMSEQLRTFADRLRKGFNISFNLFSFDVRSVAEGISEGDLDGFGLPPSIRFDRILVSNVFDDNYVGIREVLKAWGPLLSRSKTAAIVGYFMNWFDSQPDGRCEGAGGNAVKKAMTKLQEIKKVRRVCSRRMFR